MPFATLLAIAVALAMDAFAVSLATGICLRKARASQTLRMAGAFGFFQAAMPVAGWVLGLTVRSFVTAYAGWAAFGLLSLVGGKMIWEGARGDDAGEHCDPKDPTKGLQLIMLAVATSIDALAVGLSFSVLGETIWFPALVIGVVCFVITAAGVKIGCMAGHVSAVSRYAEVLGGLTLVGIGLNIVLGG
ncbi:manganese efflux pump MntP family protein [Fundidesulfovibrio terrae]|uniref:manganese efflux pump MntP n=1 Tax=Fundidesulfovibrio terrae TaxID=2922866 RepID=UPI001FB03854|nr:manganese efflux pump MntP family protein [Fundidesulfovibrio terrae]